MRTSAIRFGTQPGVGRHPEVLKTPGRLVVVSGPSGVGKGTIIGQMFQLPDVKEKVTQVPSLKTRPPRPGEEHARDYRHVSKEEFQIFKRQNRLFQWDTYNQHYYGTLVSDVLDKLNRGLTVLMELTAESALLLKKNYPSKTTTVFIAPPPPEDETLMRRLILRGTDDPLSIRSRVEEAKKELALKSKFDQVIVSEEGKIAQAAETLRQVVLSNPLTRFMGRNKQHSSPTSKC